MNDSGSTDHTADLILEFTGAGLEELFGNAATAMLGTMVSLDGVGGNVEERIRLEAPDLKELLVRWLNEILFLFDSRGLLLVKYEFERLGARGLVARAVGDEVDLGAREVGPEIKAATYHGVYLEKEKERWRARVLFDL